MGSKNSAEVSVLRVPDSRGLYMVAALDKCAGFARHGSHIFLAPHSHSAGSLLLYSCFFPVCPFVCTVIDQAKLGAIFLWGLVSRDWAAVLLDCLR